MADDALELDTAVRNWVFIPLTLCILLMKLLSQYVHMVGEGLDVRVCVALHPPPQLARNARARAYAHMHPCTHARLHTRASGLQPGRIHACPLSTLHADAQMMAGPSAPSNKELKEVREQQAVTRSQRLRMMGRVIPETAFRMRKEFLVAKVRARCAWGGGG